MKQESDVIGRDEQLAALSAAFEAAEDAGQLVAVQGPAGVGKSALLRAAAETWRAESATVITVRFAGSGDPYGFDMLLQSLRDHFGHIDEPLLSRPLSVLGRLVAAYEPTSAGHAPRIALEIRRLFDLIARRRRAVLVVDDVDAVPAPALVLGAASRPGMLVIAAMADGAVPSPGTAQLRKLADLVIDVPALSDEDAHSVIAKRYQAAVDGTFLDALRAALGPLLGHPGTLTATLEELEKHQRIRTFAGHACLADPAAPIELPREHVFVRTVRELGATDLMVGLGVGGLGIDELPALAEAGGGEVCQYGQLVDRLVEKGLLLADDQGVLRCSSPALAHRLCAEAGPAAVARLRRSLAEVLLRRLDRREEVNSASLLAVVADAGSSMTPDPRVAMLLESAAIQAGGDFERVAKWLRAALWHAADYPPQRARIITRLLNAVLRLGRYDLLRELVDEVAGRIGGWAMLTEAQLDDLAAAAMLAAVHTGIPVPASTVAALRTGRTAMPAPLAFAARWFAGADLDGDYLRESDSPRDAMAVLAGGELRRIARGLATRPDAALSVFAAVLGSRYAPPATGVLAAYRRVRRGYAGGDFVAALAAARELELIAEVDTPVHAVSRLLAAEMCRLRGEHTVGAEWAARVPADGYAQALRVWVATGFAIDDKPVDGKSGEYKSGDGKPGEYKPGVEAAAARPEVTAALEAGCAGYHACHRGQPGLESLLLRLIRLAMIAGRPDRARRLLSELESLAGDDPQSRAAGFDDNSASAPQGGTPDRMNVDNNSASAPQGGTPDRMNVVLLSARAIVGQDASAAHAAVRVARRRQELPALLIALLAAGPIVTDAKPLLYEAYALAAKLGAAGIRGQVVEIMRERGISPPHARSARAGVFSTTELDIIELVSGGLTNRQIAVRLRLSVKSVENYLTRLFARTGCRSRLELAAASMEGSLATVRLPDSREASRGMSQTRRSTRSECGSSGRSGRSSVSRN